jgi:hypothetical protein
MCFASDFVRIIVIINVKVIHQIKKIISRGINTNNNKTYTKSEAKHITYELLLEFHIENILDLKEISQTSWIYGLRKAERGSSF